MKIVEIYFFLHLNNMGQILNLYYASDIRLRSIKFSTSYLDSAMGIDSIPNAEYFTTHCLVQLLTW